MAYQPPNTQVQATTTTTDTGMSRWYPLGFLLASIAFFILGGALFGAWSSNNNCYYDTIQYSTICSGNNGLFYGGAACCAIGGILKLLFWITLFLWCVRRRRGSMTTVVHVNSTVAGTGMAENKPSTNASSEQAPYYYPQSSTPAPTYTSAPGQGGMTPDNQPMKYCGNCGTAATTPFCPKCGAQV
jgi:hypothetical protein